MLSSVDEAGDDRLVLVDLMDRPLGSATKTEVHRRGLLHRAFSVLLWRKTEQGTEILIQKRAQEGFQQTLSRTQRISAPTPTAPSLPRTSSSMSATMSFWLAAQVSHMQTRKKRKRSAGCRSGTQLMR